MTEEIEDNNSWNEMIFQHIRARKDWILALIWRGRLEHENDTGHNEGEGFESKKKMNPNQENPHFAKWCEERKENFEGERGKDRVLRGESGSNKLTQL